MPIRSISRMGHPVLRIAARDVTREELASPDFQRLIDDMVETMHDAEGVGLAAPQVYEGVRLLAAELRPSNPDQTDSPRVPLTILANPRITRASREISDGWEGCLSIPDIRGVVPRHESIEVSALDREGKAVKVQAKSYFARILQHEIDHLDGILFLDRMPDLTTLTYLKEYERHWNCHDDEE